VLPGKRVCYYSPGCSTVWPGRENEDWFSSKERLLKYIGSQESKSSTYQQRTGVVAVVATAPISRSRSNPSPPLIVTRGEVTTGEVTTWELAKPSERGYRGYDNGGISFMFPPEWEVHVQRMDAMMTHYRIKTPGCSAAPSKYFGDRAEAIQHMKDHYSELWKKCLVQQQPALKFPESRTKKDRAKAKTAERTERMMNSEGKVRGEVMSLEDANEYISRMNESAVADDVDGLLLVLDDIKSQRVTRQATKFRLNETEHTFAKFIIKLKKEFQISDRVTAKVDDLMDHIRTQIREEETENRIEKERNGGQMNGGQMLLSSSVLLAKESLLGRAQQPAAASKKRKQESSMLSAAAAATAEAAAAAKKAARLEENREREKKEGRKVVRKLQTEVAALKAQLDQAQRELKATKKENAAAATAAVPSGGEGNGKAAKKVEDLEEQLKTERAARQNSSAKMQNMEDSLCIVCCIYQRDVLFEPCKHLLVCASCSDGEAGSLSSCPNCSAEIEEKVKVFC